MNQKYLYIVLAGTSDSANPKNGFVQIDEKERFSNLKDAQKFYNSIKKNIDWSAPYGITYLVRVALKDVDAYDSGEVGFDDILKVYYQPQRYNGCIYRHRAFEE